MFGLVSSRILSLVHHTFSNWKVSQSSPYSFGSASLAYLCKAEPPHVSARVFRFPFSPTLFRRFHLFLDELDIVRILRQFRILLYVVDVFALVVVHVAQFGELFQFAGAPVHAAREPVFVALLLFVPRLPDDGQFGVVEQPLFLLLHCRSVPTRQ